MKNFEQLTLLMITILFLGLMIGLFAGRYWAQPAVQLSVYDQTNSELAESSQPTDNSEVGKININIATASQLAMLPGIGETYAQRIVDYRNEHGLFVSINDLEKVDGIGKKRIEAISEYITVGG